MALYTFVDGQVLTATQLNDSFASRAPLNSPTPTGDVNLTTATTVTLKDSITTIQDDSDATKKFKFQASGISTATTRTITVPDANITLVGAENTQTISGDKTFSGTVTAVTQSFSDSSTKVATTAFVKAAQVGGLIGYDYVSDSGTRNFTATIPVDNTTPQNTEGTEYTQLSASYTPQFSTSLLEVEFFFPYVYSLAEFVMVIFRDAVNTPLQVAYHGVNDLNPPSITRLPGFSVKTIVSAGSTSATTFKIRIGNNTASQITVNGNGGSSLFNGTASAYRIIREIKQ